MLGHRMMTTPRATDSAPVRPSAHRTFLRSDSAIFWTCSTMVLNVGTSVIEIDAIECVAARALRHPWRCRCPAGTPHGTASRDPWLARTGSAGPLMLSRVARGTLRSHEHHRSQDHRSHPAGPLEGADQPRARQGRTTAPAEHGEPDRR